MDDLGSLVEFLSVYPFDNPESFRKTFISSGDSWGRLKLLIQCIAIRRTKATTEHENNLPQKTEIVQRVHLDRDERQTYDLIKRHFALSIDTGGSTMNAFSLILRLRQVCNHGDDLLPVHLKKWIEQARVFSDQPFPDSGSCEVCNGTQAPKGKDLLILSCLHELCQTCISWDDRDSKEKRLICPLCEGSFAEAIDQSLVRVGQVSHLQYKPSSKVKALVMNLKADRDEAVDLKTIATKR